jgi:predicted ATP-grasp superfamily ATP-dependent carboligase
MHVFVYEYLSSGAAGDTTALPSLHTEGWAMLAAVLEDLAFCPGVHVTTLVDVRRTLPCDWPVSIVVQKIQTAAEREAFHKLAAAADWSLVVAPEFDGILAERSRWVVEAGGRLLGSDPEAIDVTADKLLLARRWSEHGIPTPSPDLSFPLVCKPRFGAGSQATFFVRNSEDLVRAVHQGREEGWIGELMFQQHAPGLPTSVAFLGGEEKRHSLPAVEQRLSCDGRFRYLGGSLPLPGDLDRRARHLAERAVESVEGLQGWFGVDLVLGDARDGSEDLAIEINPRLTTSYLGLRRLARFNLAEEMLAIAEGSSPTSWNWMTDFIVFGADGSV